MLRSPSVVPQSHSLKWSYSVQPRACWCDWSPTQLILGIPPLTPEAGPVASLLLPFVISMGSSEQSTEPQACLVKSHLSPQFQDWSRDTPWPVEHQESELSAALTFSPSFQSREEPKTWLRVSLS